MAAKSFVCLLLASRAFANGFDWMKSRDELSERDDIHLDQQHARRGQDPRPDSYGQDGSPSYGQPSSMSSTTPSPYPSSSVWRPGGSTMSVSPSKPSGIPSSTPAASALPYSQPPKQSSPSSGKPSMQPSSPPTKAGSKPISSPSTGKSYKITGSKPDAGSPSASKPALPTPSGSMQTSESAKPSSRASSSAPPGGKPVSYSSAGAGKPSAPSMSGVGEASPKGSGGAQGGDACKTTCATQCPGTGPTATLGCGALTGTTTSLPHATATVNKFLGVPFAQSPPQRFSPPQKAGSCNIEAKAWKPACIQQFVYPKAQQDFTKAVFNSPGGSPPEESEDCLYLNVYAPSSPAPYDGRPVLFWLYGGALQFGTASQPGYDGSWFAAYEDVIVVTINYRTNVFGFATSPEIPIAERNLGFLDQRAALQWVQENIAAFGGSPDKVTIFGESAGGFSVDALLTSYPKGSNPPFRGAILESGQISYNAQARPSTVPQWDQLAELLGCPGNYASNLTCLRAANANAIKNAIEVNILEFNPTADNVTLVSNPLQMRLDDNIAHIPVFEGSNAQEGRVFAVGQSNLTAYLNSLLPSSPTKSAQVSALVAAYSPQFGTGYDAAAQFFTELVFQCSSKYHALASASVGIPTWRYYYNASFTNIQPFGNAFNLGVYHSSEIGLVFSTYPRTNVTTQEYALSRAMRSMWARFAKNPAGGPGWNQIGTGIEDEVLVGATSEAEGGLYLSGNGTATSGMWDLGVLGNAGDTLGSGVTVVDQSDVDQRCALFEGTYASNAVIGG